MVRRKELRVETNTSPSFVFHARRALKERRAKIFDGHRQSALLVCRKEDLMLNGAHKTAIHHEKIFLNRNYLGSARLRRYENSELEPID